MMTLAQAWASALDLHRAGELAQAEQLYRRILDADPNHDGALHRWASSPGKPAIRTSPSSC